MVEPHQPQYILLFTQQYIVCILFLQFFIHFNIHTLLMNQILNLLLLIIIQQFNYGGPVKLQLYLLALQPSQDFSLQVLTWLFCYYLLDTH